MEPGQMKFAEFMGLAKPAKSVHDYQVIVGNVGTVFSGSNGFKAVQEYCQYIAASKADTGRASGEPVTLMRDGEPWKEYTKPLPQWFVEVTDTYGGEANYCWVNRYLVFADTQRGAISKVSHESNYSFRKSWDSGDTGRYNAVGACVCAFVSYADWSMGNINEQYMRIKTL